MENPKTAPGINIEGSPTITVYGLEVPLSAYWRIVDLWNEGKSEQAIARRCQKETGNSTKGSISIAISGVLENLRLMHAVPITATTGRTGLKRSTLVTKNHSKPIPKRLSTSQASSLNIATTDLATSLARLNAAQATQDKLVTETMQLAAQKESLRKSGPDSPEKKQTEAAIDLDMRRALRKHLVAESEVDRMKMLVKLNRGVPD